MSVYISKYSNSLSYYKYDESSFIKVITKFIILRNQTYKCDNYTLNQMFSVLRNQLLSYSETWTTEKES